VSTGVRVRRGFAAGNNECLALAIVIALGSGIWIAEILRGLRGTSRRQWRLRDDSNLFRTLPDRRDELDPSFP